IAGDVSDVDGRLLILLDASQRLTDAGLTRGAIALDGPPEARTLVTRHLARLHPDLSADAIEGLLSDELISDRIASITPDNFDAYQLRELARDLAEMSRGRATPEDAIGRFQMRSQLGIAEWFNALTDAQFALVVALATLNGMSFDAVSRAAKRLEDALAAEYRDGSEQPRRGRQSRYERLAAARAVISLQVRRTRYGP